MLPAGAVLPDVGATGRGAGEVAVELLPADFPQADVLAAMLLRAGMPMPSARHMQAQLVAFRLHYEGQALARSRWYSKWLGWLQRNPEGAGGGRRLRGHEAGGAGAGGCAAAGFESAAERVARRARETGFVESGRRA
jgi:hypothetical protein